MEFNLGVGGIEHSDGANIVGAMRKLVEGLVDPIRVKLVLGDEALTFDVLQAEPKAAYKELKLKSTGRSDDGSWRLYEPILRPPGEIDLDWMQVSKDLVVLRGKEFADAEFADWLRSYAENLSSINERSALVIDVDHGVDSGRLFNVLKMLSDQGLDRILIERQAEQAGADQPATSSESESQDIEKPKPPSGWHPR